MDRNKFVEVCTQKFLIAPEFAERYADEAENNGRTYEAVLGAFAEMVAKNRKQEITNYKTHRRKPMKTNTKAKFILITVVFVLITTIVLGVCPLPIYWKIPVMFLVLVSEYMAVMMGYMCKEGDDD